MHQALLIEEIQLCVFNHISGRLSKRTLAALARTCQTFTEAALNVLWCDLRSFAKLIQCMPQDLWTVESETSGERESGGLKPSTLKLHRPITPSDWAFFRKYSRRVRSMGSLGVKIDGAGILSLLYSPSAPTPLLPNLTSLGDQHSTSRSNVFEGLKRSISRLQNLKTIIWPALGSKTIMSLAQLPALIHVTLNLQPNFSAYIESLPPRSSMLKPAFSRMHTLTITGYSLRSLIVFLDYFNVHLENLKIALKLPSGSPSPATMIQRLSTALGSSSSRDTLHRLTVRLRDLGGSNPPGTTCEIGPLLQFHRLEYLDLDLQCPFIVNDATLLAICGAWPNISTLLINRGGPWLSDSYATPSGLVTLLERCPKLEFLSLPLDFSSIDSDDSDSDPMSFAGYKAHDTGRGARLQDLVLGPFIITHPHAVAKFFATILPGPVRITMRWGEPAEEDDTRPHQVGAGWSSTETIYRKFWADVRNGDKLEG
ncbi:hypothetical protein BJ138DRAFT_1179323 [Hygrophoropsis aurantiaca]|uniref:Uncharacterized protein n=1 Tax=Hygrophoropsis aurantiaca TaxID=72124 RepID=A0ACB8AF07_9AGAM|nr:hypothetical protein BJ138DRAFT_1179323 [Hygrophoropsis aurantiaca]